MSLTEVLNAALDKIQYLSKTETVFGDPITAGDVTLIPVSKVSIGFAAGGADTKGNAGSGTGTGGGVSIVPVALISVSGGKVQIHSVEKKDPGLQKILSMAPEVISKIQSFLDKREKKKKQD